MVNPENFPVQGAESPEGQAFVLLMLAAYRDYAAMPASAAGGGGGGAKGAAARVGVSRIGFGVGVGALLVALALA